MKLRENIAGMLARQQAEPVVKRGICWGKISGAKALGCPIGTRYWAHAWIRRHMEALPLSRTTVLDAGSGLSNPLLDWYRSRVQHAYLVDFLANLQQVGNCTVLRADLEKPLPLPDESVDLVTSASSIEHLSRTGQRLFMQEAQRVLRRRGLVIMTISYVFGLDERALRILSTDPAMVATGCTISAILDLKDLLSAASRLRCPEEPDWARFPGFQGFSEEAALEDVDLIFDRLASYGDVRCLPETDALGLKWAEIGLYLVKK